MTTSVRGGQGGTHMKYGFAIPNRGPLTRPDTLAAMAKRGEELGYHAIFTGDHVAVPTTIRSQYPYTAHGQFPGSGDHLDLFSYLSFIAGQTKTIQLVAGVLIVPYRHPLLSAKALATIDVLSNGRLVVGVGVGWMREEFEALGLTTYDERGAITNEYIHAFKELWTTEVSTFKGKYCQFSNVMSLPKPVQKPHPPIWVGGESPAALRRTAEMADGWYPVSSNPQYPLGEPEQLEEGLRRLASYARRAGRDPAEIDVVYKTYNYHLKKGVGDSGRHSNHRLPFTGSPDEIASDIRRYEKMGVTYLVTNGFRTGASLEEGLSHLEDMATLVWPRV